MIPRLPGLNRRGMFRPLSRAALVAWAWGYRHEVFRWGRSLWMELLGRDDGRDPGRILRTGRVLIAIASEEELRNARELKQVTITDDVVGVRVKPGWRELPRLIEKVSAIKGIKGVTVNGAEVTTVAAR
jgi:hypothetical protein